ncbi:hypothetical protein HON22_04370 [Candidatus Peregrinibacteria bacterium]|nr:hypothetical protein [Candidatus Peregrinibacteria bacterium]
MKENIEVFPIEVSKELWKAALIIEEMEYECYSASEKKKNQKLDRFSTKEMLKLRTRSKGL